MGSVRNRIEALTAGEFFIIRLNVAQKVGGLHEAILLDYIVRWAEHSRDGWVFRTESEIEADTMVSRHFQRKAREQLAALGLLEEERRGVPARNYYRINYEALHDLLGEYAPGSDPSLPRKAILPDKQDNGCLTNKGEEQDQEQENKTDLPRTRKTMLPRDWEPDADERSYARQQGVTNIAETIEDFKDYWLGHGKPMADWTRTWQRWCREAVKRQRRYTPQTPARPVYGNTEAY